MKPTVTIGIPAYNEADNLDRLLPNLLSQTQSAFRLNQIVVISDKSTDSIRSLSHKYKHQPVRFIFGHTRLGKPARINQLFSTSETDLVVVLDADIKLAHCSALDQLLQAYQPKREILFSGSVKPLPPQSLIEQIAFAGIQIWELAKIITPGAQMYFCDGSFRAFSKLLYKKMVFPNTSADDAYSYIYCLQHGWQFVFEPQALANYRLPANVRDYWMQQRRYLTSPLVQSFHFSKQEVEMYFSITWAYKLQALLTNVGRNPIFTLGYLLLIIGVKLDLLIRPENTSSKWPILKTTKMVYSLRRKSFFPTMTTLAISTTVEAEQLLSMRWQNA